MSSAPDAFIGTICVAFARWSLAPENPGSFCRPATASVPTLFTVHSQIIFGTLPLPLCRRYSVCKIVLNLPPCHGPSCYIILLFIQWYIFTADISAFVQLWMSAPVSVLVGLEGEHCQLPLCRRYSVCKIVLHLPPRHCPSCRIILLFIQWYIFTAGISALVQI